jgi:predicted small secreted protein
MGWSSFLEDNIFKIEERRNPIIEKIEKEGDKDIYFEVVQLRKDFLKVLKKIRSSFDDHTLAKLDNLEEYQVKIFALEEKIDELNEKIVELNNEIEIRDQIIQREKEIKEKDKLKLQREREKEKANLERSLVAEKKELNSRIEHRYEQIYRSKIERLMGCNFEASELIQVSMDSVRNLMKNDIEVTNLEKILNYLSKALIELEKSNSV